MRRFIALILVSGALAPVAAPADALAFETLSSGSRGDDVRLVQRALTRVGIRTTADGAFGSRTARNVRRYEQREDLRVDGTVSRGQARGLLRRAGMDPSAVDTSAPASEPSRGRPRAAPPASSTFPVEGEWKQGQGFGGGHKGDDLLADCGTPVIAAEGGRVVFTGAEGAAGNYVVVRGATSGEDQVYMHLQGPAGAAKGDAVAAGEQLGVVGRTGNATACLLHFEIWTAPGSYEGGAARDPQPDLKRWAAS